MPLSKERQASLAAACAEALTKDPRVVFEESPVAVRRLITRVFGECEKAEAEIRKEAERKVGSMKRNLTPGSADWDLQIRKEIVGELDRMERFRIPFDRLG